jgi:hypothetical protein
MLSLGGHEHKQAGRKTDAQLCSEIKSFRDSFSEAVGYQNGFGSNRYTLIG